MILAGKILAEAASIHDKKEAVMTQSYGPEARGGASKAEVIISNADIDYPKVTRADILLAMTQEALDKYSKFLNPQGLLLIDETFVGSIPSGIKNIFKAPFNSLSMKLLGTPMSANIIALGSLVAISNVISREALIRTVLARVPAKALILNRLAVDLGFKVAYDSNFKWDR